MKDYKIYCLRDPRNNLIRYIGQTTKTLNQRLSSHICLAKKTHTHKNKWILSLLKEGINPKIEHLLSCKSAEECNENEIFFIKCFKDLGYKLTNSTSGGEGINNFKLSEGSRLKISKSQTGKNNSMFGKTHPKEIILQIADKNKKPIIQLDLLGNEIKIWKSAKDASKKLKIDSSSITKCCKGKLKSSKGFIWKYKIT